MAEASVAPWGIDMPPETTSSAAVLAPVAGLHAWAACQMDHDWGVVSVAPTSVRHAPFKCPSQLGFNRPFLK